MDPWSGAWRVSSATNILDAIEFAKELDIKAILRDSGTESWKVADKLAEAKIPILIGAITRNVYSSYDPYDTVYSLPAKLHEAGVLFARSEGIVPAPEANHAVKGAIEEALRCKREGRSETILFNLCGHGHFDMAAYQKYFAGELKDETYDERELAMALSGLPSVPEPV